MLLPHPLGAKGSLEMCGPCGTVKRPPPDVPALMIWASTVPAIPLFLCFLPLGPWSSLFHILVLVLTNLGHSSPSVKELSEPASEKRRWTHTFSCHFQVQTSSLSCCGSSTGEQLYKCNSLFCLSAFCTKHMWHLDEVMPIFMENKLWRSFQRKLHKCFWPKPNLHL